MAFAVRFKTIIPIFVVIALTRPSSAWTDRFASIEYSNCGKACVGKRLNQVSRFGCTDNNRLFKDAPAVACLCSEAGLERIIASCMQTVCPQDQEGILGIPAFLDKFCLPAPAVVVQHNVVIRQEGSFESSGIIEPSGIIESSGIIEPSGIVEPSGIIGSSGIIIDPGPTDSSIPLGPTTTNTGGAITSHVVSVPTSTLIDAPIFTTTSPAATPTGSGKRSPGGLSKGAIAGIVVGVVIGVFALAAGAFLVWRRHKGRWADRTGASNSNTHDLPESVGAETRMKTVDESSGGGVVKPKPTQSATNNSTVDPNDRYNVTSLPELISIENRDGSRQQPSSTAKRKEQKGLDDLRRLEEEERKIAEAITHAEHLERLRIEQRAVQARIQEARNG